jgi:sucrose-6-phosphate hydrolase SacC (GH32 family)
MTTPGRCPKCHSNAVSIFSINLETFEEEHHCRCLDCGHDWYTYTDMTDADEIRDMKFYVELQREERGDY